MGRFRDPGKEADFLHFYMTSSLVTPAAACVVAAATFVAIPAVGDGFTNRISLPDSVAAVFLSGILLVLGTVIFVQRRRRRWGSAVAVERVNLIVCTLVSIAGASASFIWNCMTVKRVGGGPQIGAVGKCTSPNQAAFLCSLGFFVLHFRFLWTPLPAFGTLAGVVIVYTTPAGRYHVKWLDVLAPICFVMAISLMYVCERVARERFLSWEHMADDVRRHKAARRQVDLILNRMIPRSVMEAVQEATAQSAAAGVESTMSSGGVEFGHAAHTIVLISFRSHGRAGSHLRSEQQQHNEAATTTKPSAPIVTSSSSTSLLSSSCDGGDSTANLPSRSTLVTIGKSGVPPSSPDPVRDDDETCREHCDRRSAQGTAILDAARRAHVVSKVWTALDEHLTVGDKVAVPAVGGIYAVSFGPLVAGDVAGQQSGPHVAAAQACTTAVVLRDVLRSMSVDTSDFDEAMSATAVIKREPRPLSQHLLGWTIGVFTGPMLVTVIPSQMFAVQVCGPFVDGALRRLLATPHELASGHAVVCNTTLATLPRCNLSHRPLLSSDLKILTSIDVVTSTDLAHEMLMDVNSEAPSVVGSSNASKLSMWRQCHVLQEARRRRLIRNRSLTYKATSGGASQAEEETIGQAAIVSDLLALRSVLVAQSSPFTMVFRDAQLEALYQTQQRRTFNLSLRPATIALGCWNLTLLVMSLSLDLNRGAPSAFFAVLALATVEAFILAALMPLLPFAVGVLHVLWSFLFVTIAIIIFPKASLAEAPNYLVTVWCIIYSARGSTGLPYIAECLTSLYALIALSIVQFAFVNRIGFQTVLVYPVLRTCAQLTTNYRNMQQSRGAFLDGYVSSAARVGFAEELSNVREVLSCSAPIHMVAALIRRRCVMSRSDQLGQESTAGGDAFSVEGGGVSRKEPSPTPAALLFDFLIDPVTLPEPTSCSATRPSARYGRGNATHDQEPPTPPVYSPGDGFQMLLLLFCHVGFFDSPLDAATCQPWRLQSEKLSAVLQRIVNPLESISPAAAASTPQLGTTFVVRATATLFVIVAAVAPSSSSEGDGTTLLLSRVVSSDMGEDSALASSSSCQSRISTRSDTVVVGGPPFPPASAQLHKAVHTAFIDTLSGEYPFTILAEVADPRTGGCVGCIPGEARLTYDLIGPDVTRAMQLLLEMTGDARTFGGVWMSPRCQQANFMRNYTPSNAATKSIFLSEGNVSIGEKTCLVRAA